MLRIPFICAVLCGALVLFIASCGGSKVIQKEETYDSEAWLAKADTLIAEKDYEEARRVLLEVKNRDTGKRYSPIAQLKYADTYLKEGDPDLAVAEYRKFIELYPDNAQASYAQYQIAMSYFNQIEGPDRGTGAAQKALAEFLRLKQLFPRNPYKDVIDLRMQKCRDVIADGSFMVGEFYFRKGAYSAALGRFEQLLREFPEYKRADQTLLLIGRSYLALKQADRAREAFTLLLNTYPSSPFAAEAKKGLR
jgi:outer membrane protein assembly factor BamD